MGGGSGPTHGFTRHGRAVHGRTMDHHPAGTAYQRFNKTVAIWLVGKVGTMTCFWIFNVLSFVLLPPTLAYDAVFGVPGSGFAHWYLSYGFIILWTFVLSTYLQLVLLPGLMVGQNLQNEAGDARAAKAFEDTEDLVAGQKALADAVGRIAARLGTEPPAPLPQSPAPTAQDP